MQVIHQPRVAWDAARTLVAAMPDDDLFGWLAGEVGDLLGPDHERDLRDSRDRLCAVGDALVPVEVGRWRVRLEDTLRSRPAAAEPLHALVGVATRLLRARQVSP
ncbi:hypothetical protein [Micromonospora endolithica]|uniref:hypothetical protein n=1 Tax=Micromonospora endolithica TaxID=230091 RepID=UPI0011AD1D9C|nr:hypothetical protein [Micromonospora endolithica]TWJ23715.1 hypothetical protein JD76_03858 [Micromonospora endolithica]